MLASKCKDKKEKKIKILLIGKNGQVGWELQQTLTPLGKVIAYDRSSCDLSSPKLFVPIVREIEPNIIVNAAAYTAVDQAEKEPDLAMAINGIAPGILAEEAAKINALLIHYSTDYVFDGKASYPYREEDPTNPINIYGKSKLVGEQAIQSVNGAHFIFRTSWVYGTRGKNFFLTMLRLAQERQELRIVNDQIGAPTWSCMIAQATAQILATSSKQWGIYNLTASGQTSWFGFAQKIFQIQEETNPSFRPPKLLPISSSEYLSPAKRPHNSLLSHEKTFQTFSLLLPHWEESLQKIKAIIN